MTTSTTDDRNYYAMMNDEELVERAGVRPTAELAVVLARRLARARRKLNERLLPPEN
jgi:hypothetical protein